MLQVPVDDTGTTFYPTFKLYLRYQLLVQMKVRRMSIRNQNNRPQQQKNKTYLCRAIVTA